MLLSPLVDMYQLIWFLGEMETMRKSNVFFAALGLVAGVYLASLAGLAPQWLFNGVLAFGVGVVLGIEGLYTRTLEDMDCDQ
jgi:hypothetical protein